MLEIVHPASINPRLVRRRLRHIAVRGAAIHKKYLYGSICMLPVTSVFMVLPLPNIPFFWTLFRAYSHWRALQGSERLHLLVSDCSGEGKTLLEKKNGMSTRKDGDSHHHRSSMGSLRGEAWMRVWIATLFQGYARRTTWTRLMS
uniref:Uncharacterized protein n=1 Tax=Aegilops tauschii subsp. strangulata TaxID=200361 RepID=A0A453NCI4_AEGTS